MSLRTLYVDLNSFFASAEQQLRPELRGRPVGILPVMADTTCCIAASIDAKRFGVRTGTPVWQARKLCRDIVFVQARPAAYVDLHHRIVAAVESCTPVGEVLSIDEMACELMGSERAEARAIALGKRIKRAIYAQVGEVLHCSIGIAPNRFLAKTASNMHKPDGLVVIRQQDLPDCLYGLQLGALNGIGRAMEARLRHLGIQTVEQLWAAGVDTLRRAWNGIEGERYHARLHGEAVASLPTQRASLGHSHVLPPDMRDPVSAQAVLYRLLHKAAMRLRHYRYTAGVLTLHLHYRDATQGHRNWVDQARFSPHADTFRFNAALAELWQRRPADTAPIVKLGIVFSRLVEASQTTRDLFDPVDRHAGLNLTLDRVNQRYGPNTLYFGGAHKGRGAAPMRIAFSHIPELQVERDG
ncbi:MAG: DNA polymerase [Hydrogenophilales bacterium 16-64-46]|nr:MAG: DNA polymerase [Hydrogenophilales bacterium 12-64-13]OYZ05667.1 MAG: DNA polymerase [Hydrogenophilales bacterium 16-64-46]OZA40246.1 MAG: DNA polymerase [Hydrogenophilales bacterium 17-64-34]HQT00796.1 DNA polymerase [Thiobacillus sp.]